MKFILGEGKLYNESLKEIKLTTLKEIQNELNVKFTRKCSTSKKTSNMFKKNMKEHTMKLRNKIYFKVKHSRTVRMEKSAIIYMTHQLNNHMKKKEKVINK